MDRSTSQFEASEMLVGRQPEEGLGLCINSGLINYGLINSGLINSGLINSGLINSGLIRKKKPVLTRERSAANIPLPGTIRSNRNSRSRMRGAVVVSRKKPKANPSKQSTSTPFKSKTSDLMARHHPISHTRSIAGKPDANLNHSHISTIQHFRTVTRH